MHELNKKAIQDWKAEQYANAYREYINGWLLVGNWASSYFPEELQDSEIDDFYEVCKKFHNLGF